MTYINYVTKRYPKLTVVFDGYPDKPSTKDITHMRRTRGVTSPKVTFNENMLCKTKKEVLLSNTDNKRSFLNLLSTKLCENGCTTINAKEDADVLIVQTALELANTCDVVLIEEDADLLVLLCYHADIHSNRIYFKSESKQAVARQIRVWDITKTKIVLGEEICRLLPALHAMTGCDTTSRLFGIGKGAALKTLISSNNFKKHASIFLTTCDVDHIVKAGEEMLLILYGGISNENLDILRYHRFASKVAVGNVCVQVHTLPPISALQNSTVCELFYSASAGLELVTD